MILRHVSQCCSVPYAKYYIIEITNLSGPSWGSSHLTNVVLLTMSTLRRWNLCHYGERVLQRPCLELWRRYIRLQQDSSSPVHILP